jgi:hypothetical protein
MPTLTARIRGKGVVNGERDDFHGNQSSLNIMMVPSTELARGELQHC